jgi:hypothetical protein
VSLFEKKRWSKEVKSLNESKKELERINGELDEEIHRLEQRRMEIAKRLMGEEDAKTERILIEDAHLVREITDNPIPSILTLSLREIMKHYGEAIVKLKARGGEHRQNRITLDKDCGVVYASGSSSVIEVDYEQERAPDGMILNPLDKNKRQEVFEHLDNNLPKYEDAEGRKHSPDIPVELLVVEIEDDRIAELAESKTNTFDAEFISEKTEPRLRSKVHDLNYDLGVYQQGFELRNLNLILLLERAQKFTEPKKLWNPVIQWGGYTKQDPNPKSPIETAGRIRDKHLPPKYAMLKTYRLMRGNRLALDGYR